MREMNSNVRKSSPSHVCMYVCMYILNVRTYRYYYICIRESFSFALLPSGARRRHRDSGYQIEQGGKMMDIYALLNDAMTPLIRSGDEVLTSHLVWCSGFIYMYICMRSAARVFMPHIVRALLRSERWLYSFTFTDHARVENPFRLWTRKKKKNEKNSHTHKLDDFTHVSFHNQTHNVLYDYHDDRNVPITNALWSVLERRPSPVWR